MIKPRSSLVSRVLACTAVLVAAAVSDARATVPADLCTGNPCVVSQTITVDAGSDLDFGGATELRLAPTARLTVGPGGARDLRLTAGRIILQGGATILGGGDSATVELVATSGEIDVQRSGSNVGRIDVSGLDAGSIALGASGSVVIAGDLVATGSGRDAQGGSIEIAATGDVSASGSILASATGNGAAGGGISIETSGSLATSGTLSASGAAFGGGEIVLAATGDVSVAGTVNVSGSNPDGSGGGFEVASAEGDVSFTAAFSGTAGSGAQEACGDGAIMSFEAARDVTLGGTIDVSSGTHCVGGELAIVAGRDVHQAVGATFKSRGPGLFGAAGTLSVEAGGTVVLRAADLSSNGVGGILEAVAPDAVEIRGSVDASASGADGIGGTTFVRACHVVVGAQATLDTRGSFVLPDAGFNRLQASGSLTVNGTLRAASANLLDYKGIVPVVAGTVAPAATVQFLATLPDCPPVPECGNGTLDTGEVCDDGNTDSCDGCSADCLRMDAVCGDGERECGEQCDDGNLIDGDGCESSCFLTPTQGVRVRGAPKKASCVAHWSLAVPDPATDPDGLPSSRQSCSDGDPACDVDGQADGVCTFDVQVCLRVPDAEVPACTSPSVKHVTVKRPNAAQVSDPIDQGNAAALTDALLALGGTVKVGGTKIQTGSPITGADTCTDPFQLQVPHLPGAAGTRTFNIAARGNASTVMRKNQLQLGCETHEPICGDGILQAGEACEDGNTGSCDGCSASCTVEGCGNGIVDCGEECDEGEANGGPDASCSATCERLTPDLRIPGAGAARFDCALEWSVLMDPEDVPLDRAGIPRNSITCTDNDPTCDLDPQANSCRMRLWACFGGADERLGCSAQQALGATLRVPRASVKKAPEIAARGAMLGALEEFPFPAGPGERCTQAIDVDIPVRQAWLELKLEVPIGGARYKDRDALRLKCLKP